MDWVKYREKRTMVVIETQAGQPMRPTHTHTYAHARMWGNGWMGGWRTEVDHGHEPSGDNLRTHAKERERHTERVVHEAQDEAQPCVVHLSHHRLRGHGNVGIDVVVEDWVATATRAHSRRADMFARSIVIGLLNSAMDHSKRVRVWT